jgi:mevalonate kinase
MNNRVDHRYYANGKLLISGEYLVLKGAKALAVPLKLGQWMEVEPGIDRDDPCIRWRARVMDRDWFSATIRLPGMDIAETTDISTAKDLTKLLKAVGGLNKNLMSTGPGFRITTNTTFDHSWGLGSSSALIVNLAQWAQINPFDLCFRVSAGSGYDVAAAMASGPILYSFANGREQITPVTFIPPFFEHIWFVYQGNKQNTAESLGKFTGRMAITQSDVETINRLTQEILDSVVLIDFMHNLHEHEELISRLLGITPVKEKLFGDFRGEIKSLGAWGGDFVMAASEQPKEYVLSYFNKKGIQTVFSFGELVLV